MIRRIAIAAATVGVALSFTGCTATVSKSDMESQIKQQLTSTDGTAPDSVSCPDDLKAKVGEKARCTLKAGSDTYGVSVTVTSVDNNVAKFDIAVDDKPE